MVCEPVFLARYAEKAGSGILDMIALCRDAGLPEPEFRQDGGQFVQTIWRDWLTDDALAAQAVNERQKKAIGLLRVRGKITNAEYQREFAVAKRTASLDLSGLVAARLLARVGVTGKGVHYYLAKGAPKGHQRGKRGNDHYGGTGSQRTQRASTDRSLPDPKTAPHSPGTGAPDDGPRATAELTALLNDTPASPHAAQARYLLALTHLNAGRRDAAQPLIADLLANHAQTEYGRKAERLRARLDETAPAAP